MNLWMLDELIERAFKEDMPYEDMTTELIFGSDTKGLATLIAKEDGVVAGLFVAQRVFEKMDSNVSIELCVKEGQAISAGTCIMKVQGSAGSLLKAERTALNLLQRMSGIATASNKYVKAVEGLPVRVVDTRKTTPTLRFLEKYAVVAGGAWNHRYCLSDAVMIKDNHIAAAGGITNAVSKVKAKVPHTMTIEVEVTDLVQLQEAIDAGAQIIMLDNMELAIMEQAVKIAKGKAILEASGGITLETVRAVAETGVDVISVGALTHSVKSMDISMRLELN